MATPSEEELYPEFDERIYDMIQRFPAIINENWPFDVGRTARNLGHDDVMGLVMTIENWAADRPPTLPGGGRRVWWGQPNESIFNLGKRDGLFTRGLSYENFIKAINDARIHDLNLREQRKSEDELRALGASGGLIAEIERDRAVREAAGAAANAENAARAAAGRVGGRWGSALVQYRRHGIPHGYYSRASPGAFTAARYRQNRAGALDKVVGTGGQGAEQGNESGMYVRALPRVAEAAPPAAPGGREDSGSPPKKKARKRKGGRRRRRNTRRRRRSRSRRRRKSRRRKSRRRKKRF